MTQNHLEVVHHIFAHLKPHDRSQLVFDVSYSNNIEQSLSHWTDFYKDINEQITKDVPELLWKSV